MLYSIFSTLSTLITAYSFACLLRIFMSWMPQFEYTAPGRFIAALCDPYLNWFRRFSFTRVGAIDFSPIIALGVLSVASMSFSTLAVTGTITVGIILAGLVSVIWSFFSFFLNIVVLFLAIRLVYDLFNRYGYSQFWTMLDRFLNPVISKVTRLFGRGHTMNYRLSLVLTLAVMFGLRIGVGYGIGRLVAFLMRLPV